MKVSIITVVYNRQDTIAEAIESVLQQTYTNIEYIVVDGFSSDGTVAVIRRYADRITKFISEKDNGLYEALNKGISMATGDVIGFLHADDAFCNDNVIERIASAFIQYGTDSIYADLVYVDKLKANKQVRSWKSGNYKQNKFLYGWMPPHPTFYVKRDIYKQLGMYNTDFKSAADYELMLRYLYKHHISTTYIPEYLVKMRTGGKSNFSLRNRINANREDNQAWLQNGIKPKFYTRYLKPLRKLMQFLG